MRGAGKRPALSRRATSLLVGAATGILLAISGCSAPEKDRISATFTRQDGSVTAPFSMEVAADNAQRQRGLMFRKSIGPQEGMIFVFPSDDDHSFWMKNTLTPLDMVFVSEDWRVVGVIEDVPPLSEVSRSVGTPSRYVLEFAAGTTKRLGIGTGDRVTVEGNLPSPR